MSLDEMPQKHEPTVANILRDKAHGWSLNYYNDKASIYDVPLARARAMLELMKKETELHAAQKRHAGFLACSKRPEGRLKEDIKAIESVISQLKSEVSRLSFTSYGAARASSFSRAEDIIHTLSYKQLLEQQRTSSLQRVRNLFMVDGDVEAMRQGVETVETRFTTSMASLSLLTPAALVSVAVAPVAAAALAPVAEPAAAQPKRSRAYSEEEEEWTEPVLNGWRGKIKEWD
jgi:hypothetical protein